MAQRYFYTWIHDTNGPSNDSFIPATYASAYWNSLIFDVNHRTIWHQGMPFGNVYPGTASYGEVFNDIDSNVAKAAYGHAEGRNTIVTYTKNSSSYSSGAHAEGISSAAYDMGAHAEGMSTVSSYKGSHAEGNHSIAYAHYSHAEGNTTITYGESSHAENDRTKANGNYAHAEGSMSVANGQASHSEGTATQANGNDSHAEGHSTISNGQGSHAEGTSTQANGQNSHAEGQEAVADGMMSHAEGYDTKATADYSHAEGYHTSTTGNYSHIEGRDNQTQSNDTHVEGYHNFVTNNSLYSHVEGINHRQVMGTCQHVEGSSNIMNGLSYNHVEGYKNDVRSNSSCSHVDGQQNVNDANYSTVSGLSNANFSQNTIITGTKNTSYNSKDSGNAIFGNSNNSIYGSNSIISGDLSYSYGSANLIEGHNNKSFGNRNVMSGDSNLAYANNSVIVGESIIVGTHDVFVDTKTPEKDRSIDNALAIGKWLQIHKHAEVALGTYNVSYNYNRVDQETNRYNSNKSVFSIGIGSSDSDRRNAMDVRDTGVTYLYNTSYVWENEWEYYDKEFPSGLYPIATTSYVMRNGVGRRNWTRDPKGNLAYITAEYFNNYDGIHQNKAYGPYSHAEGFGTYTHYSALASHASGLSTVTYNVGEFATGSYNYSEQGTTLFSVGNGQNSGGRSNAITVYTPASAKDGIVKIENDTIITNKTGNSSWYTLSAATYIWSGTYLNYKALGDKKGYDDSTLYFIEDGDGYDRNDFVTKDDIEKMIEKINAATDVKLNGIVKSAKVIKDQTNNTDLIDIANACSSPVETSYIWTGTAEAYDKIRDKVSRILSQTTDMTAYMMVKNMQFIIQNS